jgi:hypothetical protein
MSLEGTQSMAGTSVDDLLKQRLVQYLDHLEAGIRQGSDFVASQAPDVAREIVAYNLAYGICAVVAGLLLLTSGMILVWNFIRKDENPLDNLGLSSYYIILSIPLGFTLVAINIDTVLQCYFAPKYFVIQQIMGMLK